METIYKYPIEITDRQPVTMPKDAKILTVQVQNDVVCLWAMVNPQNKPENVMIRIHGTGHTITDADRLEYIGTFQLPRLVFHVFKEK